MDDLDRVVVIGIAGGTEHHRAEAQLADRDAAASQRPAVHGELLKSPRPSRGGDGICFRANGQPVRSL
jgi:hypothetical protein